jgi:two-component system KDP operon response regulator KdpE
LKWLLIEDDENIVESIQLGFKLYLPDLTLESTAQGRVALQILNRGDFDGILVDLGLPDIDGIELIEKLRNLSRIPILVVSARHSPDVICQALKSGANEYITKPFICRTLAARLTNYMRKAVPVTE